MCSRRETNSFLGPGTCACDSQVFAAVACNCSGQSSSRETSAGEIPGLESVEVCGELRNCVRVAVGEVYGVSVKGKGVSKSQCVILRKIPMRLPNIIGEVVYLLSSSVPAYKLCLRLLY